MALTDFLKDLPRYFGQDRVLTRLERRQAFLVDP